MAFPPQSPLPPRRPALVTRPPTLPPPSLRPAPPKLPSVNPFAQPAAPTTPPARPGTAARSPVWRQPGRLPNRPPLLSPAELERFKSLLVFARSMVEGFFAGKHRSPHRGSSVEFTDYKEYVSGDDVQRLDWRVYGRSRRLYVRQFEAETDMVIYLLVDVSASMSYAGAGRQSKYVLGAKIAAALAYLMIHQGDKAALVTFADTLQQYVAPGGTHGHLLNLIRELESVAPASTTGIASALHECQSLFRKRGRLVVLSDFWTDPAAFFEALGPFLHRKFEILLLHVVDPDELSLPPVSAAHFEDLETAERVEVEPEEIRAAYCQTVRERLATFGREAANRRASHALVTTDRPYIEAIEAYLGFRGNPTLSPR